MDFADPCEPKADQCVTPEVRPMAKRLVASDTAVAPVDDEQPVDKEDLAGKPFVGPAGRILDRALADAGIPRDETFVTNAVKHFKFEPRGKRRLHKKPNAYEIDRCKWWFEQERAIVKPELIVALGVTAARSVMGRAVTIGKLRGAALKLEDGAGLVVTVHPSSLLRIPDADDKRAAYAAFVKDLK